MGRDPWPASHPAAEEDIGVARCPVIASGGNRFLCMAYLLLEMGPLFLNLNPAN